MNVTRESLAAKSWPDNISSGILFQRRSNTEFKGDYQNVGSFWFLWGSELHGAFKLFIFACMSVKGRGAPISIVYPLLLS